MGRSRERRRWESRAGYADSREEALREPRSRMAGAGGTVHWVGNVNAGFDPLEFGSIWGIGYPKDTKEHNPLAELFATSIKNII